MMAGIYMITGCAYPPTNHGDNAYGGKAQDLDLRFRTHKQLLKNGNHHNTHLQNYYNKHGEDSLKFVTIKVCEPDELEESEKQWIEENQTFTNKKAFNQTIGGDGGATHSLEYAFINTDTGETVFGNNIAAFCRLHPELNKDCMYRVHSEKQESHKGWKKQKESEPGGSPNPLQPPASGDR
jgi:hypothetical protein